MTGSTAISRILTLVFTDLADSTALKTQRGDQAVGALITRLSTWCAFPVIARNSNFQYRGGNRDLKKVSAEVDARRNAALRQAGLE